MSASLNERALPNEQARVPIPVRRYAFAPSFTFGASTSAYQIEGSDPQTDGRGPSIWEEYFAKRPDLDNGTIASDHYNRMLQDVMLMKNMGLQAYRFSIAWPRVLPEGHGKVNQKGMDFYDRLVDNLLANGITPFVTLYHWDLPLALGKTNGWLNRETCHLFADYAALMGKRLGDRVANWTTFNEPEVIVAGYIGDGLAPGLADPKLRITAGHHLMVAHGLGTQALRAVRDGLRLSIVLNLVPIEPSSPNCSAAARRRWQRDYAWYLDGVLKASYPEIVLDEAATNTAPILAGDMALISQKLDFLGINWYLRLVVDENRNNVRIPGAEYTQMPDWEICPGALSRMLLALKQEYSHALASWTTLSGPSGSKRHSAWYTSTAPLWPARSKAAVTGTPA